jgi:hypothetical protein
VRETANFQGFFWPVLGLGAAAFMAMGADLGFQKSGSSLVHSLRGLIFRRCAG